MAPIRALSVMSISVDQDREKNSVVAARVLAVMPYDGVFVSAPGYGGLQIFRQSPAKSRWFSRIGVWVQAAWCILFDPRGWLHLTFIP